MARSGFVVQTFSCPKDGLTDSDYEDASAIVETDEGCRVAIADGATESSFAQLWAHLLVERFAKSSEDPPRFFDDLGEPRTTWKAHVGQKQLPWYAEEKAGMGAFAAILGFRADSASRQWIAVALGDCCVFQLDFGRRGARLVESFPMQKSYEFGFNPFLLGTNPEKEEEVQKYIKVQSGTLRPDDVFLFASDAVSAWFLKRYEEKSPLWRTMTEIRSQAEFSALVDVARRSGDLHNDDSTLVRLIFRG